MDKSHDRVCFCVGKKIKHTPMEKEHHPIEKENHLNQTAIQKFKMSIFQGLNPYLGFV